MNDIAGLFNQTKILVVGGAGFVGSNLVKMLLYSSQDVNIKIVDNLLSAEKINIPNDSRIHFIESSITDDNILKQLSDDFDYVFHLATFHGNQSSIHDPLRDHENNVLTTLKLFERIKKFKKIKKVVYSSAGCSVAKKTLGTATATTEDDPIELKQDSPYSISKIIGEFYSLYYYNHYNLPIVRARFQNVYGPGEILGAGKWRGTPATVWRNVTPTFIYKALKSMPLPVENNGVSTRDFIYVDDICCGLIACALLGNSGDVYNLANGNETSILDLAKIVNEITNNPGGIQYLPKRNWDNSGRRFGSTEKSDRELGFKAKINIRDGIEKTKKWTIKNLKLIDSSIKKHAYQMSELGEKLY